MSKTLLNKVIASNKKATFDYQIEQRVVAGVALKGYEAKSIRSGNVSLKNSYANIKDGELWLHNVHVGAYSKSSIANYEPSRIRKLLVRKNELDSLIGAKTSNLSIVVLAIGTVGKFIKIELGLGHGKKLHDKRGSIKKRQHERDIAKRIKNQK